MIKENAMSATLTIPFVFLLPSLALAQGGPDPCVHEYGGIQDVDAIGYNVDFVGDFSDEQALVDAIWPTGKVSLPHEIHGMNACTGGGDGPWIEAGGDQLDVRVLDAEAPSNKSGTCAEFNGVWGGDGTITVYTAEEGCDNWNSILPHEFGHWMGLKNTNCTNYLMPEELSGLTGPVDNECWRVDRNFYTQTEEDAGEARPGGTTPLVLDLDGGGIPTTNFWTDPVVFDLTGDGSPEHVGWIAPESEDAFLALDLNDNGRIDSGRELFGEATLLPSGGTARHGFAALEVYDAVAHGGNGDGKISAADSVWADLVLWNDWNHDGQSQINEVRRVHRTPLIAMSLRFNRRSYEDDQGNLHFRMGVYWEVGPNGRGQRTGWIEDIVFQH